MTQLRVAIIGAGVVGRACAVQLAEAGFRVDLFDPDTRHSHASWGNAGHIAVEQVEPLASPSNIRAMIPNILQRKGPVGLPAKAMGAWLPFSLRMLKASPPKNFQRGKALLTDWLSGAVPAWQRVVALLGSEDLLRTGGHMVIWQDPQAAQTAIKALSAQNAATAQFQDASSDDLYALREVLGETFAHAIRYQHTAQVSSLPRLREAYASYFTQHQIPLHADQVISIHSYGEGVQIMTSAGTSHLYDRVLLTAGHGAATLLSAYGVKVPMIAERGYHLDMPAPDWPDALAPLVFPERSIIATRFEGSLRLAGFVEFAHKTTAPDQRKWAKLQRHAEELGLPIDREKAVKWMGARPTLPDYLPAVGLLKKDERIAYAFGHQHLGLTLSALTAEIISDLMVGKVPAHQVQDVSVERFC